MSRNAAQWYIDLYTWGAYLYLALIIPSILCAAFVQVQKRKSKQNVTRRIEEPPPVESKEDNELRVGP